MFFLRSQPEMEQSNANRVAETILAAPGWARVGITAPASHIRVAAAQELARAIPAEVTDATRPGPTSWACSCELCRRSSILTRCGAITITPLYSSALALREARIHRFDVLGLRNQCVGNDVDESE